MANSLLTVRFLIHYANSNSAERGGSPMKSAKLKLVERTDLRTVAGRKANEAYRTREHLTESEMDKLLAMKRRQSKSKSN